MSHYTLPGKLVKDFLGSTNTSKTPRGVDGGKGSKSYKRRIANEVGRGRALHCLWIVVTNYARDLGRNGMNVLINKI